MPLLSALWKLYLDLVLHRRVLGMLLLLLVLGLAAWQAPQFRLDASADSLILENDEDLRYYRQLSRRYSEAESVVVTYTPEADLFADATLQKLKALRDDLEAVDGIASVTSILDVPLVASPPMSLSEVQQGSRTLLSPGTDREMARQEFAQSPLYRSLLTDPAGETTAMLATLEGDQQASALLRQREDLRLKASQAELSPSDAQELARVEAEYAAISAERQADQRELIARIRSVLAKHEQGTQIFLGGLPMIAADMISFVEQDIRLFGGLVLVLLIALLGLAFRQWRWVLIPIAICAGTLLVVVGLTAWRGWPVTVVSSNFSSLTLIITLALVVHLVVRFRELQDLHPEASVTALIEGTLRNKLAPSFYTTTTTMVSFGSLIIADIRPVIDFGMMMVAAVLTAFLFTFLLFPVLASLLKASKAPRLADDLAAKVTQALAGLVRERSGSVLLVYLLLAVGVSMGIARLGVENRFIDYFKDDTEIYQGLVLIDKKLGGTTPLDIIVRAPQSYFDEQAAFAEDFGDFGDEFGGGGISGSSYWFNRFALDRVDAIHAYLEGLPETGKVLSMSSTMGMLEQLNNNEPIDNFTLAIMYNRLPADIKRTLFDPYLGEDGNEVRFALRVIDSDQNLNRNDLLQKIEADLIQKFGLEPEQLRLAGALVLYNNVLQSLFSSQILTLGVVFALIVGMLWALFGSLRIALAGIVPTVFAALSILGLMGWAGIPLDIMTITIAAITIGIGVDNTIHYTHRYVSELQAGNDGRAIYLTSVIVTLGFSILALSNFIPIVLFGLLTGLAMLVAFIANLTLLPSLLMRVYPKAG
ncbi:MAG: efflux RND transporter permease subunit [Oceanococcaceae bacterium]